MYVPKYFEPADPHEAEALLADSAMGLLVTAPDGLPVATHVPIEYRKGDDDTDAQLLGHMARANEQWRHLEDGVQALMIVQGPDAYISPGWYTRLDVPTWDYQAVHVYGEPALIPDGEALRAMLARLVARHEGKRSNPIRFEDYDPAFVDEEIQGMVGFRLRIQRVEASFKLSQNRAPDEQERIIDALEARGDDAACGVAAAMRRERRRQ